MQCISLREDHGWEENIKNNNLIKFYLSRLIFTIYEYVSGTDIDNISPTAIPIRIATAVRWIGKCLSSRKDDSKR